MYRFKVIYDIKHIDKKSALYGLLSSEQTCKFATLQSAIKFAKDMEGKRTSKIQVMGRPIIERV
jgi:hypothetical protein